MRPSHWAMLPPFGMGLLAMGIIESAAGGPPLISAAGIVVGAVIAFLAGFHFQQMAENPP